MTNPDGGDDRADGDDEITQLRLRAQTLEDDMRAMMTTHVERLINAELKAEAVQAGMIDLDGLKLIDATGVTCTDHGDINGAANAMAALCRAKPWLFRSKNSSSTAHVPQAVAARTRHASEMSVDEWRNARAGLLRGSG